jgi:hypothetical protein
VRIDEATGAMKATASVSEGDKNSVKTEIPGGIKYQGKEMEAIHLPDISYEMQHSATFTEIQSFSWQDAANKPREFKFKMNQIKSFDFEGDTVVAHDKPTVLRWDGSPLEKGEALVMMWENQRTRETVPVEVYTIGNEARVDLPAAKMSLLSPGKWTLYLVRKKLIKTAVEGTTVVCKAEQYTRLKGIKVL